METRGGVQSPKRIPEYYESNSFSGTLPLASQNAEENLQRDAHRELVTSTKAGTGPAWQSSLFPLGFGTYHAGALVSLVQCDHGSFTASKPQWAKGIPGGAPC